MSLVPRDHADVRNLRVEKTTEPALRHNGWCVHFLYDVMPAPQVLGESCFQDNNGAENAIANMLENFYAT